MGLSQRKWIFDNWSTILRELAYHKEHKEIEQTEFAVIWKKEE